MPQNKNIILLFSTLVLLVVNFFIIGNFGLQENRIARVATSGTLFMLFIFFNRFKDRSLVYVFLSFIIADVFMLDYENLWCNRFSLLLSTLGYFILASRVFNKVKFKKAYVFMFIVFTVIGVVNAYLLYELVDMIQPSILDKTHELLLYTYGLMLIVLTVFASNYNYRYNTKQSMYFMYFVIAFVFADISSFVGYYFESNLFFFFDRTLYILGFQVMIVYAIMSSKQEEEFDKPLKELYSN